MKLKVALVMLLAVPALLEAGVIGDKIAALLVIVILSLLWSGLREAKRLKESSVIRTARAQLGIPNPPEGKSPRWVDAHGEPIRMGAIDYVLCVIAIAAIIFAPSFWTALLVMLAVVLYVKHRGWYPRRR